MKTDRLAAHLLDRPAQLKNLRQKGTKVIGYFPGNYVPEELIFAAGAVPVCLIAGGSSRPAREGLSVVPNVICPFARAQIGERQLGENPYYEMLDAVVAPITCQHLKKVAEIWDYRHDLDVIKLGVPHQNDDDSDLAYFSDRLKALRSKLEAVTGREVTNDGLREAINLYDRMRGQFRELSLMRRDSDSSVSTLDFIKLNHDSYHADPAVMVDELQVLCDEAKKSERKTPAGKPRLLLMGPNLAHGDYDLFRLVDEAGGSIVVEDVFEGVRNCQQRIDGEGDPIELLARSYLKDRVPPAFMRSATRKRLGFVVDIIQEYHVSAIIWYQLLCCETYDQESYFFYREMRERGVPMLVVESGYDALDTGALKTRLEAFIELVKGGSVNG